MPTTTLKISTSTKRLSVLIPFAALALTTLSSLPMASAYGQEQWQTTFSGNCNAPAVPCPGLPPGRIGFWGWCTFGGGPTGPQTVGNVGTNGDCQITVYLTLPNGQYTGPTHFHQDITSWNIGLCSAFLPPTINCTTQSFFAADGTITTDGPGAGVLGLPPGPVPFVPFCGFLAFLCDTGIPAIAGHYDFDGAPGFHINIHVTRIPNT